MLTKSITFEKQCAMCKLGSGLLFTAFGTFNATRAYSLWVYMRPSDKLFNVAACSMIYLLAGASFYKGYEI